MADLGRFLMRPASYDSGLRFGDPNVRWGNPGYVLEPGESGRRVGFRIQAGFRGAGGFDFGEVSERMLA
jgi:hypothetical protein